MDSLLWIFGVGIWIEISFRRFDDLLVEHFIVEIWFVDVDFLRGFSCDGFDLGFLLVWIRRIFMHACHVYLSYYLAHSI
jgi:hypothetical protein